MPARLRMVSLVVLVLRVLVLPAAAAPPPTSGLVAYWALNETVGATTAADSSGAGKTGTLSGANGLPVFGPGLLAGGLAFDGVDDKVSFADITVGTSFSFTAWVRPAAIAPGGALERTILAQLGWTTGLAYYVEPRLVDFYFSGASHFSTQALTALSWQHIAVVSTAGAVTFYLNTVPNGTASGFPGATFNRIGGVGSDVFEGAFDDIRLYDRALTAAEIQDIYQFATGDTTAPTLSNGRPTGQQLADAVTSILTLTTDEAATCKYSEVAGQAYAAMPSTFASEPSTQHATTVTGVSPGAHTFFVRCADHGGTVTTSDFLINFSVYAYPGYFAVYDALFFAGQPDLRPYGMCRNYLINGAWLFPDGTTDFTGPPQEATTREEADATLAAGVTSVVPVQLDLESWPIDIRVATTAAVDVSIGRFVQAMGWFKSQAPTLNVGWYGTPPLRDYWAPVSGNVADIAAWQAANTYLSAIVAGEDALYPSLYTFYEDQAGWVVYARANILEAKRLSGGKPVYPYLWPQYHDAAGALAHTLIPHDYWLLQLQTVKAAGADGIIVWGGLELSWDPLAGWWQATLEFLQTLSPVPRIPCGPATAGGLCR
jgi:hypothetical protein